MIPEVKLNKLKKRAKKAHKKCIRKIKKALRANDLTCLRMSLGMAQVAVRKIEVTNAFNSDGSFCPSRLKRN